MTSNSQAEIYHITQQFKATLHNAGQCGWKSLEAHRDAGHLLAKLKDQVPRGQFGRIVKELCGCEKPWSARLRYLDKRWNEVLSAFAWAQSDGQILGRRAYSVDGAVALVHRWEKRNANAPDAANAGAQSQGSRKRNKRDEAAPPAEVNNLRSQLDQAETELAAAHEQILALKQELHSRRRPIRSESWPLASGPIALDAKTQEQVRRTAAQWNPRIPGSTDTIETWIKAKAEQFGWPPADLLRACGVEDEGIADYTFASREEPAS